MLDILYKQILLFSDDGKSLIDHPNFLIQEVHKISGIPRKDLIEIFKKLLEINFLEKVTDNENAIKIKQMMSLKDIEDAIKASC